MMNLQVVSPRSGSPSLKKGSYIRPRTKRSSSERRAFVLDAMRATLGKDVSDDDDDKLLSESPSQHVLPPKLPIVAPSPIKKNKNKIFKTKKVEKSAKSTTKTKITPESSNTTPSTTTPTEKATPLSFTGACSSPVAGKTRQLSRNPKKRSSILVPTISPRSSLNDIDLAEDFDACTSPRSCSLLSSGTEDQLSPDLASPNDAGHYRRTSSVKFANFSEMLVVDDICTNDGHHEILYYNKDELAEFRHESFLEKCGLADATYLE
eukprot:scaffold8328_cov81-Cylindrotheca_fusiformis.AAC.1